MERSRESREQFYDREIAPVLLALAKKCEAECLSFVAMVEWEPGETGRTAALTAEAGFGIRMAELAARACGNVDSLIWGLMKYGNLKGHNSICLEQLGVPTTPDGTE